jgi:hypothetical protein
MRSHVTECRSLFFFTCVGGGGLRNRLEDTSNWSVTLHLVACNVHAYLLIFTCEGEFTSLSVNFSL